MQSAITAEVVEPYAEALMSLAKEKNVADAIGEDVRSLVSLLKESAELKALFASPMIKAEQKKAVIRNIAGEQINPFLLNFLLLLVDKGRISFIEGVLAKYLEILRKLNNTVLAEITSAVRLYEGESEKLMEKVKTLTGASAVEIETKIDPDIIGGVIIKVGSQVYDASLRGQLRRITLGMLGSN
ncbi:F0F1 ATP synthase subunit delta [Cyanobacterium stanieri LEGE 03274]|uniref:ATP synthase subunit delta n=1 Tax=Cyanobacterium stanieri LEGE 03274 TaxID=1828756 RepID=A0ABR9V112_9CHRO|nr:ATP synthase F1 subunit delta [Cyanobacterium stanieri]MBE9221573.1 F0F1 ATP synthase subunit delta [Cyanobacterium stanieri LEGE 03274]